MLLEHTLDKLKMMKMRGMVLAVEEQLGSVEMQELSFEDRLGILVDREFMDRENRKLTRRLREARFRFQARMEDIEYKWRQGLDRAFVQELGSCEWIRRHHNLILTGPTGIGKTFIACALGNRACELGFRVSSWRMPPLFNDLSIAKVDGSYGRLLAKIKKLDLLIIDDWGISTLTDSERRDFLEIIEDRYELGSTIMCGQVPRDNWHETIGDPTIADSIVDRLVHNAYEVKLTGESIRKRIGKKTIKEKSDKKRTTKKGDRK